jgi:hypothetical protein
MLSHAAQAASFNHVLQRTVPRRHAACLRRQHAVAPLSITSTDDTLTDLLIKTLRNGAAG